MVVNNAGITRDTLAMRMKPDMWQSVSCAGIIPRKGDNAPSCAFLALRLAWVRVHVGFLRLFALP